MKTVLVTGGTGSLGKLLVRDLCGREDIQLVLLVRGESDAAARARVEAVAPLPESAEVYAADLQQPLLGLSEERHHDLASRATHILHAAASTRFNAPLEDARANNVDTTRAIIAFAKDGTQLARFGYLSTALVAGKRMGLIKEDEFEHDAGFNNAYQQSKYEAEALVRDAGLPVVIFRPPLVYSAEEAQRAGNLTNFLVRLVQLVVAGRIPFVPGTPQSTMDIVDGPETARLVSALFMKEKLGQDTYHVSNGTNCLTIETFHALMEAEKGTTIPIEYCGDGDAGMEKVRTKAKADPRLQAVYERAESFLSEPGYPKVFDNAHLLAEIGRSKLDEDPAAILKTAVHDAVCSLK